LQSLMKGCSCCAFALKAKAVINKMRINFFMINKLVVQR
jgi:hypothetical protein